jgi:Ca-activated chloride channel family protein
METTLRPYQKMILCLALVVGAVLCFTEPALADGIIIPDPPPITEPILLEDSWLTIRYHRVTVSIENQIAVTRVEQEFVNDLDWEVEGTYVFPIPKGATISKFVMWVDGIPIESKILPAEEARQIYEEIVRERRDPALLEYIGRDVVQARVYPIPPGGSRVIELEYTQALEMDQGLVKYLYPLNTEKFSAQPLEECSVRVELVSPQPLRSVYSPTHQDRLSIVRDGDYRAVAGYEEYDLLPDQDFELIYTVSEEDIGLNLLTYPDPERTSSFEREGYFLLLAAPSVETDLIVPRDIILVLDTSGSMEGVKLEQAKEAARYVLEHLNPEDRFNVIAFSTGIKRFASDLQPASKAVQAARWIDNMQALGGTNINQALLDALTLNFGDDFSESRPQVILFLTDGLPTEGVTDVEQILANIRATAPASTRLFSFGVGDDVNTQLLDTLAEENRGLVSYVRPEERIDEEVSSLYIKIQTPVLTDLEIDFGQVLVEELYPPEIPDLFAGSQLILAGRYRLPVGISGREQIELTGRIGSQVKTYQYQVNFDPDVISPAGHSFIPRLWAARKIGYLLTQIRHQGENAEWVEAVIQLSLQYGIITPYTSFLVEEEQLFYSEGRDEAAENLLEAYSGPASGADAVGKADTESSLRAAESVPQVALPEEGLDQGFRERAIKFVGEKTFFLQEGVWMDSLFDPEKMEPVLVEFGSNAYYEFLDARPAWGQYYALGEEVIFVEGEDAYRITTGPGGVQVLPPDFDPVENEPEPVQPSENTFLSRLRSMCSLPWLMGLALFVWVRRR